MQLKSLAYLTCLVNVALATTTTVAQVLADLADLKTSVTTLDTAINGFPNSGGTLTQALAIHSNVQHTVTVINTATSDANAVRPSPVDESDGQSILNAINDIVPTIKDSLLVIVEKEPAFAALPLGGASALVLQDLQNLSTATIALEKALTKSAPSDLVPRANSISSEINGAFATAIAAYQ